MTSNELKHEAKSQEWGMAIQECQSSGLSVSEWCRQRGVATTTYYRWEQELLTAAKPVSCSSVPAVTFAELPAQEKMSRNVAERSATIVSCVSMRRLLLRLHLGNYISSAFSTLFLVVPLAFRIIGYLCVMQLYISIP